MSKGEKFRIKRLDDKSDHDLWKIRIHAACSANDFYDALSKDEETNVRSAANKITASKIIIAALSDLGIQAVCTGIVNSVSMLVQLVPGFDFWCTATKILKIRKLVCIWYETVKNNITKQLDRMDALFEQVKHVKEIMEEAIQVGIWSILSRLLSFSLLLQPSRWLQWKMWIGNPY